MSSAELIDWSAWPLVPAVVQDPTSLQVLMVGFMNREAFDKTIASGLVTFYSRSRETLWTKGETSGNVLQVSEIRINCEENSLLIAASPVGPTCHKGYQSCYFRRIEPDGSLNVVLDRVEDPSTMYPDRSEHAELTRRWFGAYEYLRENDLSEISGTSKRLRDPGFQFESRIADELRELAGVLDGTHAHHGLIGDVLLEGSQIAYWVACLAARNGIPWDELRPHDCLAAGTPNASTEDVASQLRDSASLLQSSSASLATCQSVLTQVASACLAAGVDPFALIRRDLEAQQQRDYLAPYFNV
jgi:phosphoribosyl-AMP cyclohydrolase